MHSVKINGVTQTLWPENELQALAIRAFQGLGLTKEDSDLVCKVLIQADLFGLSTHGLSRVESYGERLLVQGIKARPHITVQTVAPALRTVDGDNGVGPLVAEHGIPAHAGNFDHTTRQPAKGIVNLAHGIFDAEDAVGDVGQRRDEIGDKFDRLLQLAQDRGLQIARQWPVGLRVGLRHDLVKQLLPRRVAGRLRCRHGEPSCLVPCGRSVRRLGRSRTLRRC